MNSEFNNAKCGIFYEEDIPHNPSPIKELISRQYTGEELILGDGRKTFYIPMRGYLDVKDCNMYREFLEKLKVNPNANENGELIEEFNDMIRCNDEITDLKIAYDNSIDALSQCYLSNKKRVEEEYGNCEGLQLVKKMTEMDYINRLYATSKFALDEELDQMLSKYDDHYFDVYFDHLDWVSQFD